jgi:hypothetical protein
LAKFGSLESFVLYLIGCIKEDPYHDNLSKWHIIVVDWYYMCKKSGELMDRFLFRCDIASALWNTIFKNVGVT